MKALITAGRSSGLRPFTYARNKHLLPLANKPIIEHAIAHVKTAGISEIGVVVHEKDEEIEKALGDGSKFGVSLVYIPQIGGPRGIAHAVSCAQKFLGDSPFLLYLGDNIIKENLQDLRNFFEANSLDCLLTLCKVSRPERFGVPIFAQGKIIGVEERPLRPQSPYAVAGAYFYSNNAHHAIANITPSIRGDLEISDVHTYLARNNYKVAYREVGGWWKDRGNPLDLLSGNRLALENITYENMGFVEPTVRIEGTVSIGEGSRVGGHTLLRGPIVIGEYCLIKDSYIGPYTSVGNKSEIHGGNIENSVLFEEVSIVTGTPITDSVIGRRSTLSPKEHSLPKEHKFIVGDNSYLAF